MIDHLTDIAILCIELVTFGTIPPGTIPLEISINNGELTSITYEQEDKRKVERLLCPEYYIEIDA